MERTERVPHSHTLDGGYGVISNAKPTTDQPSSPSTPRQSAKKCGHNPLFVNSSRQEVSLGLRKANLLIQIFKPQVIDSKPLAWKITLCRKPAMARSLGTVPSIHFLTFNHSSSRGMAGSKRWREPKAKAVHGLERSKYVPIVSAIVRTASPFMMSR
jgi:hypothetical protein